MSEGGGTAGPEVSGTSNFSNNSSSNFTSPPSQPATPSSTVQDPPTYANGDSESAAKPELTSNGSNGLPPFSSFSAADVAEGLGGRLATDAYLNSDGISSTRIMELSGISGWDYCYTDGRYLDARGESMPLMVPQPQYRPWERPVDGGKSGLPSFQSQFGEEMVTTLTTLTPAACSPAPSVPSPGLPSFHTLSAVNPRYPLVPAPVQAREIPSMQQQFIDERHIHLFQGAPGQNFALQPQNGTLTPLNNATTLTTLNNAQYHINNAQLLPGGQLLAPQSHILGPSSQIITSNGHILSSAGPGLTVVSQNSTPTVLTVVKAEPVNIVELKSSSHPHGLSQLHHPHFQSHLLSQGHPMEAKYGMDSPPRGIDGRKKERRKMRASSMESSNESDGAMSVESSGQVSAVSSTAGFKSPMNPSHLGGESDGMITDANEKQTKKKRKRCGECIGCQRKDNCGDCAPCRNDKSHQICKMRRCEKLTEKKGYRGKAARPGSTPTQNNSVVSDMNSPSLGATPGRENGKPEPLRVNSTPISANPAIPTTMAVPFYGGSDVWPSAGSETWNAQGQFVPQMDEIRYQHYPGYQTPGSYQQAGFNSEQSSAFQPQFSSQPNSSPSQGSVTPRSSTFSQQVQPPTPSPIGSNPPTPHVNGHRNGNGITVHYVEDGYVNGNSYSSQESPMVPPPSTTPASRCSSAHGASDPGDQPVVSKANYMSGNDQPGYPPSSPQTQSSCNSNGYPGQAGHNEFGEQPSNGNGAYQNSQKSPAYNHPSPGYQNQQNYQNYTRISPEQQKQSPSQKHGYPQSSPNKFPSPAPSPSYEMYEQRQTSQYYGEFDKNNVNARIKNMIMSKQGRGDTLLSPNEKDRPPNDYGGKKNGENENQNHFLAFSHHLREGSLIQPGGGGYPQWGGAQQLPHNYQQYYSPYDYNQNTTPDNVSAMERFMKFASADFHDVKPYQMALRKGHMQDQCDYYNYHNPIKNLEAHFPTKHSFENNNTYEYYPGIMHKRYPVEDVNRNVCQYFPEIKTEPSDFMCDITNIKSEPPSEVESEEDPSDSMYPKIDYAPLSRKVELIDKRFDQLPSKCQKWEEYLTTVKKERIDEESSVKSEASGYEFEGSGGPQLVEGQGAWCCRMGGTDTPTTEHLRDGCCQRLEPTEDPEASEGIKQENGEAQKSSPCPNDDSKNVLRSDVPECNCFPHDKVPPEPGSYYTHLGAAANLKDLRAAVEERLGCSGKAIRIEKIRYTGKEGKTTQGCPLAKWVIRRSGLEERFLAMVKLRQGHTCSTAWIVVCIIAWEGVPADEADKAYNALAYKLNRFGLPTTRRCGTNEPRTCACQGIDPDVCGTSYSFGCSWSMYYNGCKYARSKTVRKFRLSVRSEEQEVEERMHVLATVLSPLYKTVAPEAFHNQTVYEREASECRLGFKPGRPFSGVTACVDFCAHSHRDLHNMNNGCTVVVSLTKHRSLSKPDDEQLHVLPLYVMDDTDEFGSKEKQEEKYANGSIDCLTKFPCEVRMRAVPLQPCRRHGKKRRDEDADAASPAGRKTPNAAATPELTNLFDDMEAQLQVSQVSSTVSDGSVGSYNRWQYPGQASDTEHSPLAWGNDQQKARNWTSCMGYDRDNVGHPDSTTAIHQGFSPSAKNRASTAGSHPMGSPMSSPLSSHSWHHGAGGPEDKDGDYPSSPSPMRQSPTSSQSPFRIPKGRPPSRPTHLASPDEHPETFLKPLPRDNHDIKPDIHSTMFHRQYQDMKPPWCGTPDDRYSQYGYPPRYPNQPYYSPPPFMPSTPEPAKAEPIGEVTDYIENEECFRDTQMGGVGIALGHGSVLFEVAKQELHATTALKRPNRQHPTRISLVFYQHRNLNRAKHGWDEWEEKMRLRKLGVDKCVGKEGCEAEMALRVAGAGLDKPAELSTRLLVRAPTHTTTTWTTLFRMRQCMVTGPYQEGGGENTDNS